MKPKILPQDSSTKKIFLVGLLSLLLSGVILGIFWTKLPPQIPLFFSRPRGESQLGTTWMLAIPLAVAFFLLFFNSLFAQKVTEFILLKKIIVIGAVTGCILAAITVLRIIFLVL